MSACGSRVVVGGCIHVVYDGCRVEEAYDRAAEAVRAVEAPMSSM